MNKSLIKKIVLAIVVLLILTSTNVIAFAYFNDLNREQTETIYLGEWLESAVGISTPQEFYDNMTKTDSASTDIFYLKNDIDFTGFNWEIDSNLSEVTFRGVLDGNGYTISNLTIYTTETTNIYFGLFPKTEGATIQNITFDNLDLTMDDYTINYSYMRAGLLVGRIQGGENNFSNINIIDSTLVGTSSYGTGGLIGQVYGSNSIVNIDSIKTENFKGFTKSYYIGGLIGYVYGSDSTINISNIDLDSELYSFNKSSYVGGVIGKTRSSSTINISNAIVEVYSLNTFEDYSGSLNEYARKYLGGVISYNQSSNTYLSNIFITGDLIVNNSRYYKYVGSLIARNTGSYNAENTYYANLRFMQSDSSLDYSITRQYGIMAEQVSTDTLPNIDWWNEFFTNFDQDIWYQNEFGKPTLN